MITSFNGEHRFLSNFWPCDVQMDGITYRSVEHGYQAAKTLDQRERRRIAGTVSPGRAKKLGNLVKLRDDWDEVKPGVMFKLLKQKFQNEGLREKLLATGNNRLVEGNTWHDNYWGVCHCGRCSNGKNMLGRLLMKIRDELGGVGKA